MRKIAVPIFQNRVSPVLDSCKYLLVVDTEAMAEKVRSTVYLGDMSLTERCNLLCKLKVTNVICGGVSELFANLIKGSHIALINGIAGNVDDVISAFLMDRLYLPEFYMPGYKPNILVKDK
jgi:predicted Fe-Mo cluster-binding NifX family protein